MKPGTLDNLALPVLFALRQEIIDFAKEIGFDLVGFSPAKIEEKYLKSFDEWLLKNHDADMSYMRKIEQRRDMEKILPGAKSVIVLLTNYYRQQDGGSGSGGDDEVTSGAATGPAGTTIGAAVNTGKVARYAYGRDYHKVIGKKLKQLEKYIEQKALTHGYTWVGRLTRSYVDTGPVMERALAEQAGLGRIGKNACLITKEFGSWVFISEIITTLDFTERKSPPAANHNLNLKAVNRPLSTIQPHVLHARPDYLSGSMHTDPSSSFADRWSDQSQKPSNVCGNCRKCIDACPTGAIIAPGVIDSRLCISYLTIENRGKIPPKLAKIIAKTKRLYGCDICQEVCPHNSARQRMNTHGEFQKPIAGDNLHLKKIAGIKNDEEFLKTFAGSPLMRAKRSGLQRNATL